MASRPSPRLLALVDDGGSETFGAEGKGEPADAALVARAVAGDRWAEEALYRRHAPAIASAVLRMVGRDSDADDVIQDTFVLAFERLSSLRDGAAFRSWAAKIAINEVRRHARRRQLLSWVRLDRTEDDVGFAALAVHGTRPDLRAELAELDRIVAKLPVEQRMAWMLHRVEGWSLAETAEALGVSTATVKRRLGAADSAIDVSRTGRGWTT